MNDDRPRTYRWCVHRNNNNIGYYVECLEDGEPVRFAMGKSNSNSITHGYRLISPPPRECGWHLAVEFGLIDIETFDRLYILTNDKRED